MDVVIVCGAVSGLIHQLLCAPDYPGGFTQGEGLLQHEGFDIAADEHPKYLYVRVGQQGA
jgi:hypothetical protein